MTAAGALTHDQRRMLASAMDRILPSGTGPSASDANAIGYVDWHTARPEFAAQAECLTTGLALLDSIAERMAGRGFVDADPAAQDAILRVLQDTPHPTAQRFFTMLVRLTLAGVFAPPSFGGNRDGVGWRSIGYEPRSPSALRPATR